MKRQDVRLVLVEPYFDLKTPQAIPVLIESMYRLPFFFKQVGSWSWGLPERRTRSAVSSGSRATLLARSQSGAADSGARSGSRWPRKASAR